MKYRLIIGYHLVEKNKEFPTIRISLDNNLIDEFDCDNEKTVNVGTKLDYNQQISYPGTQYIVDITRTRTKTVTVPCKFKTFTLDSDSWTDDHKLCVEILNNNSNYSNGFVTKRSLVAIRPIYLIPEILFNDKEKMVKFIKKSRPIRDKLSNGSPQKKWRWPGIYDEDFPEFFGGKAKINLAIKKKQNYFIILPDNSQNIEMTGFPLISEFFYSWMEAYSGVSCDVKHTRKSVRADDRYMIKEEYVDLVEKIGLKKE